MAIAELNLLKELLKYKEIAKALEFLSNDLYHLWFVSSSEWQAEYYAQHLAEVAHRNMRKVWAQRSQWLSDNMNPFIYQESIGNIRATLINACLHVRRDSPMDEAQRNFLKDAWIPYLAAIKGISSAYRSGVKFEDEQIHYRTPIIKGFTITTSEDPSKKFLIKKPESTLTKRGKYPRKNA